MHNFIREPMNGLTHLVGAILSFVGLLALVNKASMTTESILTLTAVIIFGVSMVLLYSASAMYHMVIAKARIIAFLRRLDHSMIFLLIAGSYTPFSLISLSGYTGWLFFGIVSFLAVSGIAFKMIWFNCPRWLSTGLYITMGWLAVFIFSPLVESLTTVGITLLVAGGLFYTIGGVIYGMKPKVLEFKYMGFHEIFHIFIMLGSLSHFLCVYMFVL